jgi:electron transport complex protein RnfA
MSFVGIVFTAVFVNNVVLYQLLGLCPLLAAAGSRRSALGLGLSVSLVLALTAPAAWALQHLLLEPLRLAYLQTMAFVLLIAGIFRLVRLGGRALARLAPAAHRALGLHLPLAAVNCAVLGACLALVPGLSSAGRSAIAGLAAGAGFLLVSVVLASIQDRLRSEWVPEAMRGLPITLVSAALMALGFLAFDRVLLLNLFG